MKRISLVFCIIVIATSMLVGCSAKTVDADAEPSTISTSQTTTAAAMTTTVKPAESTTKSEVTTLEKEKTTSSTQKDESKTTTKSTTRNTTTTTKKQTTTSKVTVKTTAAKPTTTKKVTTTKKPTTTKKNVTASEVQAQVNSYIRSKGITVDSSLRPDNSGWSGQISDRQDGLNDGRTLQLCKEYVNNEISNGYSGMTLYCYYDGNDFYILYL